MQEKKQNRYYWKWNETKKINNKNIFKLGIAVIIIRESIRTRRVVEIGSAVFLLPESGGRFRIDGPIIGVRTRRIVGLLIRVDSLESVVWLVAWTVGCILIEVEVGVVTVATILSSSSSAAAPAVETFLFEALLLMLRLKWAVWIARLSRVVFVVVNLELFSF